MATLIQKTSGILNIIRAVHSIGRSYQNELVLMNPDVSKIHATLLWSGEHWYIKDHSSNGTILNGVLLNKESKQLRVGDAIQFGKNEDSIFILENTAKPSSFLRSVNDFDRTIVLDSSTFYPALEPIVSFYRLKNSCWILDNGEFEEELSNGKKYQFYNDKWLFIDNDPIEDTLIFQEQVIKLIFCFNLSLDFEHVRFFISDGDTEWDFGERVAHHLLLFLAKERESNNEFNTMKEEQGWVSLVLLLDYLRKELVQPDMDQYHVNIMIHRLRKQISDKMPSQFDVSDFIERKNGKIRFRYENIQINSALISQVTV